DRGYVWKRGTSLIPTFTAFAVINLLEQHFPELVDLDFTARMEDSLDEIAEGRIRSKPWLRTFYFGDPEAPDDGHMSHIGLKDTIGESWQAIDARAVSSIPIGVDARGRTIAVRVGRYGAYLQADDDEPRASFSDELPPDEMTLEEALRLLEHQELGDRVLGL